MTITLTNFHHAISSFLNIYLANNKQ